MVGSTNLREANNAACRPTTPTMCGTPNNTMMTMRQIRHAAVASPPSFVVAVVLVPHFRSFDFPSYNLIPCPPAHHFDAIPVAAHFVDYLLLGNAFPKANCQQQQQLRFSFAFWPLLLFRLLADFYVLLMVIFLCACQIRPTGIWSCCCCWRRWRQTFRRSSCCWLVGWLPAVEG